MELKHKKISKADNLEYIKRAQNGDIKARDFLVANNLLLIKSVISKHGIINNVCTEEDLLQEGYFGLIEAINKFDTTKDTSFSTYAYFWIRQAITRYAFNHAYSIRMPVFVNEVLTKRYLVKQEHPDWDDDKIFEYISEHSDKKVSLKTYNDALTASSISSLDYRVGEDEDAEILDFISTDDNVEKTVLDSIIYEDLIDNLDCLTDREKDVIKLRFGLEDGIPLTLEEIGQKYNLTRERIRQIEKKALEKLRDCYKKINAQDMFAN